MPEMEPIEDEYEDEVMGGEQEVEDEYTREKNEQSARPFFALLSFLMAAIFLAIFLTRPLDSISGLLVLFGVLVFGIGGMLLLERKSSLPRDGSLSMHRQNGQSSVTVVEGNLVDGEEGEDSEDEGLSEFKTLVEEALSSIPLEFQEKMANLAILVEPEPDEEVLERAGAREGYTLLGLYQGVPLTAQGYAGTLLPERITIYQHAIEAYCHGEPERIRQQVRSTVLHEVAHHFGMDHEEMPIWVK